MTFTPSGHLTAMVTSGSWPYRMAHGTRPRNQVSSAVLCHPHRRRWPWIPGAPDALEGGGASQQVDARGPIPTKGSGAATAADASSARLPLRTVPSCMSTGAWLRRGGGSCRNRSAGLARVPPVTRHGGGHYPAPPTGARRARDAPGRRQAPAGHRRRPRFPTRTGAGPRRRELSGRGRSRCRSPPRGR